MTATVSTPHAGIHFKETMKGHFTLGATDPELGAKGAHELAMHATVDIPDIDAFVADAQHQAQLSGTVDFAPLGLGMVADKGVFGLFSPSGDPELTYMVYELGFAHGGKRWYLAGKKHVQVGNPLRLWGETTTLFTTLHQGDDASAPVVGAGVLALGVIDLFKLMGTLETTHSSGIGASVGAVGSFFGFFAKELTRTYLTRRPQA
jgi:hypothetical protein